MELGQREMDLMHNNGLINAHQVLGVLSKQQLH